MSLKTWQFANAIQSFYAPLPRRASKKSKGKTVIGVRWDVPACAGSLVINNPIHPIHSTERVTWRNRHLIQKTPLLTLRDAFFGRKCHAHTHHTFIQALVQPWSSPGLALLCPAQLCSHHAYA